MQAQADADRGQRPGTITVRRIAKQPMMSAACAILRSTRFTPAMVLIAITKGAA
jgi:hypothetical protein